MPSPPLRLALVLMLGVALAGCGKSLPSRSQSRGTGPSTTVGTVTKNTARLGGANPVADAAAVALATNPGLTQTTRPQAVVLVDDRDWPAALAAAALASAPLNAPLLYSEGNTLPALSAQALATMRPTGAAALGGAQVIEIGTSAAPAGYRTQTLTGSGPAALAGAVEHLLQTVSGGPPKRVIVIGADGPRALAMPAAGLAAESGAPILPVGPAGVPPATRAALAHLHHTVIYAVGPTSAVSHAALSQLTRFGSVRRIYAGPGMDTEATAKNAIAVASFAEGPFGWAIEQPGHGLVFVNASRPLDAPAAAPLSASGDYGPLLLLESSDRVPRTLAQFLHDIQPGYDSEYPPAKGAYNHGWMIGDEQAITATVQAELDSMLEISPRDSSDSAPGSIPTAEPSPAPPSTVSPTTAAP
jgi:hypothetical protein